MKKVIFTMALAIMATFAWANSGGLTVNSFDRDVFTFVENSIVDSSLELEFDRNQKIISVTYSELDAPGPARITCSVTLTSGGGTASGFGIGRTLKEACDLAYKIAIGGGWTFAF